MGIVLSPLIVVLTLLQFLMSAILYIPITIFNWVISAPVSLTHEPVVTAGWQISRDFVNIFIVIALVIIALATILRIQGYAAQKLLPQLIIAAILVNFTPVICGFILDIANIVMSVFKNSVLDAGQLFFRNNATINAFIGADNIWKKIGDFANILVDLKATAGLIGVLIAGILFNALSFIVLSAYALIFFLRIAVIWILVILSPFALIGYFFPPLKKVFNKWWDQFLQWSIIGIPLFFFLYLAEMMISNTINGNPLCKGTLTVSGNALDWISGQFMCSFLSAIFPSLFLVLGVFISFQTGAMGASMITGGVSKWTKSTGKNAGKALWKKTKEWGQERVPQRVKDLGTRMATYTPKNRLAQTLGSPLWATQRKIGRMISSDIDKGVKRTLTEAESNLKDSDLSEIISVFVGAAEAGNRSKMGGAINAAVEKGKISDFLNNSSVKKLLTRDKQIEIVKNAESVDQSKKMIRALLPEIDQEGFLQSVGYSFKDAVEQNKYMDSLLAKLIDKTKSDQVKYFTQDALDTSEAKDWMHLYWTGAQVGAAGTEFGRTFLEKFQTTASARGKSWYDHYNPRLGNYLTSGASQSLGIHI